MFHSYDITAANVHEINYLNDILLAKYFNSANELIQNYEQQNQILFRHNRKRHLFSLHHNLQNLHVGLFHAVAA